MDSCNDLSATPLAGHPEGHAVGSPSSGSGLLRKKDYRAAYPVQNLIQLMEKHRGEGNRVAVQHKLDGTWRSVTWGEIFRRVGSLSQGLAELGVAQGDRVAIFADTSLEWLLAHMAILCAGAATVPIYASDTAEEVEFILKDSGAKFIFVDDDVADARHKAPGRWARVARAMEKGEGCLPGLKGAIAFHMAGDQRAKRLSLDELAAMGGKALEGKGGHGVAEDMAQAVDWDQMATLLYTSGTTGLPKGVILTHGNWVSQAYNVMRGEILVPGDHLLLFLPLAHSFGLEIASVWMGQDVLLSIAESVDRLLDNAKEVRPTVLPAVPRVFEKAFAKVVASGQSAGGATGKAFAWAMEQFEGYAEARMAGKGYGSLKFSLARKLVFSKLSKKLADLFGGSVRCFISGGAPLAPKIAWFFDLCGMKVCEGYGLTETAASTHCNLDGRDGRKENRIGTCGPAFPELETKIEEDGEILLRGPQIMSGYYNLPDETAAALTEDGWFRTGDIGEVTEDGCLRITDRKKDLIKTSGGKYVAPAELENALKAHAIVSQVSIQGDRRRFISAIFTLDPGEAARIGEKAGLPAGLAFAELVKSTAVVQEIQRIVDGLNERLPSYATVKKFILLDHDWSQETGEMTPTLKVKRKVVAAKYKAQLDELYGE